MPGWLPIRGDRIPARSLPFPAGLRIRSLSQPEAGILEGPPGGFARQYCRVPASCRHGLLEPTLKATRPCAMPAVRSAGPVTPRGGTM